MAKKTMQAGSAAAPYVPAREDFVFLPHRDLNMDTNFASQSYWKGVAIHFFKNRIQHSSSPHVVSHSPHSAPHISNPGVV
jgi:hypothetical protein